VEIIVKKVDAQDLLPVRSKVLRNNAAFNFCKYDGDNSPNSVHVGAYIEKTLIGGVSLIKNDSSYLNLNNCYQLRGMCVDDKYQKRGIGKKILKFAEKCAKDLNTSNLWMNARIIAVKFYAKLNYVDSNIKYDIKGIGLHHFMYKKIQ
tara:strand:+ start:261 stop:704 length:444 start_codon:yes stop_codon:yes gene_type:complete